jgi:hypothetical protein
MPTSLDYAPKPPPHRRRLFIRVFWLIAVAVAASLLWRNAPPYARQIRYLYWQSRSMAFVAPPEHVAYEEDPTRAAALLGREGYQKTRPGAGQMPVGFVPPPMNRLSRSWVCMAFVGERRSRCGQKRLVVLGYQVHSQPGGGRMLELYGSGKTLATFRPGTQVEGSGWGIQLNLGPTDVFRIFWGQRDPLAADRFTMRYEFNGQAGLIDGRLLENGVLELVVRDGPLRTR